MKRAAFVLLLVALLAAPSAGADWYEIPTGWREISSSGAVPATCTTPGMVPFLGSPVSGGYACDAGMTYNPATDSLTLMGNVDAYWLQPTGGFYFVSGTYLTSPSSAVVQLGPADSASPVAHTLRVQSATGTDKTPGTIWTLKGAGGTGTGEGAGYRVQTSLPLPTTTTGTTANTFYDRFSAVGTRKTLTESSATPVLGIALPSNASVGCVVEYAIEASDGTEQQTLMGSVYVAAESKAAGAAKGAVGVIGTQVPITSSGTLTNTPTVTDGTGKVTLNLNAVSSLTQTILRAAIQYRCNGPATVSEL